MADMENMEMTQETEVYEGNSKADNLVTGFCVTGAAIAIANAGIKVGKKVKKLWDDRRAKNAEASEEEYFPEEE